jgi:hypothetical protein
VFAGRVFIVAGSGSKLGNVADALVTAQALVAVIGPIPVTTEVAAHFHADPANEDVWEAAHAIGERMVGADFDRRGHGAVIAVDESGDVERVLRLLVDTR